MGSESPKDNELASLIVQLAIPCIAFLCIGGTAAYLVIKTWPEQFSKHSSRTVRYVVVAAGLGALLFMLSHLPVLKGLAPIIHGSKLGWPKLLRWAAFNSALAATMLSIAPLVSKRVQVAKKTLSEQLY